jgi:hypothetical protein
MACQQSQQLRCGSALFCGFKAWLVRQLQGGEGLQNTAVCKRLAFAAVCFHGCVLIIVALRPTSLLFIIQFKTKLKNTIKND